MSATRQQTDLDESPIETEAGEHRLDRMAEAEIAAGKGVPHERVRGWLQALIDGKDLPPPTC